MERGIWMDFALLVIRLAVGIIFVAHGSQKLLGAFGGPGIEGFAQFVGSLGFKPPILWATVAAIGELAGGAFLILGILPRISAAVIAAIMLAAIVLVHRSGGYFAANNGFEYPLFIFMVCLSIVFAGGGRLSVFNRY